MSNSTNTGSSSSPSSNDDLSWLPFALVGGGVMVVGTVALAAAATKKTLEHLAPHFAAYENADSDAEREARLRSLVREAVPGWLQGGAHRALGLPAAAPVRRVIPAQPPVPVALPFTKFRVMFKDPPGWQGLSKEELAALDPWLKHGEVLTIEVDTRAMMATVVPPRSVSRRSGQKFQATFKDPDALFSALERTQLSKAEQERLRKLLADTWFEWSEYATIEVDPQRATARVVPVREQR